MVNLKLMIEQAGISCLDLARKLNVSQQAVYKWESGAALPSASMAELRPAQVEALAWNVLRIRDVGGAVAILRYDPQKDAVYLEPVDETA